MHFFYTTFLPTIMGEKSTRKASEAIQYFSNFFKDRLPITVFSREDWRLAYISPLEIGSVKKNKNKKNSPFYIEFVSWKKSII